MWQGYDNLRVFPDLKAIFTSYGKPAGSNIQIPSVSSSKGLPMRPSMKLRLSLMILDPKYVTMAAISMEYHLAPFLIT